ncbi:Embryogenesis-associated protein EMB8 [Dendrobium catenatum]|uniref:Embryogenesis-associated protein EMB8 n=2 Tax=Dendrobium catenatum TaxID=906689 RepID=A0A2I0XE88_9ASPA|nr:Embryogenesis-associated protein EMB8 [Dendrobium catenatum]
MQILVEQRTRKNRMDGHDGCLSPFSWFIICLRARDLGLRSPSLFRAMGSGVPEGEVPVTGLLIMAASMMPAYVYVVVVLLLLVVILYGFLEFHFIGDLFRGFRGDRVNLTFDPRSMIYENVVSKCRVLQGRYLATLWLSSPHLQIAFLTLYGRPPVFTYRRQLFSVSDGGTIALDWLLASDVAGGSLDNGRIISKEDITPIVIVVPGLTSDSSSAYVKHLAYKIAKRGWNVVVENHRGLGGVSITSDYFYNAGWTEDIREVVNHLHQKYSMAPIFAVGTSIGANILVKYLGEEGEKTPVAGAASICSPWDLVVCDRFINRRLVQRFYDRALTIGLKGYAQLHQPVMTRLANWDGIRKSRSVRDFDNHATCLVGKFETVDTYYRRCSSVSYVGNVSVPLLCISALDDPVCTKEAIPWDECRANKNIILATTVHGGHLGYFEGITASSVWWARAVDEFLSVLHSGPYMHGQKMESPDLYTPLDSSIDKSPYINLTKDGLVTAMRSRTEDEDIAGENDEQGDIEAEAVSGAIDITASGAIDTPSLMSLRPGQTEDENAGVRTPKDASATSMKTCLKQLSRQSQKSLWLLAYIAIVSSWPLVGSALLFVFRSKLKGVLPHSVRRG